MRRNKGSKYSDATEWGLGLGSLERYAGDVEGIRNFNGDERGGFAHKAQSHPPFPLLGHGQIVWQYKKSTDVSSDSWGITEVGSGTQLALQDEMGGVAKAITGAGDNNSQFYFSIAECAQIPSSGVITFRTRIRLLEPIQCDAFIGFCEKGVDLIAARSNSVGFYLDDASALIRLETNSGGSAEQESSGVSAVADTWVSLAMGIRSDPEWSTKTVNFYINGAFIAAHKTNIPTAAMAFAFGIQNGEAVANALSITTTFLLKD